MNAVSPREPGARNARRIVQSLESPLFYFAAGMAADGLTYKSSFKVREAMR
jgi:hypothetical protein